jgi:hypothetical protein
MGMDGKATKFLRSDEEIEAEARNGVLPVEILKSVMKSSRARAEGARRFCEAREIDFERVYFTQFPLAAQELALDEERGDAVFAYLREWNDPDSWVPGKAP